MRLFVGKLCSAKYGLQFRLLSVPNGLVVALRASIRAVCSDTSEPLSAMMSSLFLRANTPRFQLFRSPLNAKSSQLFLLAAATGEVVVG